MYRKMSVQEAAETVLRENNLTKYRLGKILGVQPIMINHYLAGKVKSANPKIAKVFYELFNILLDNFNDEEDLKVANYEAV